MKTILIAAAAAIVMTGSAIAAEPQKIDPAKKGPTDAVTESVPEMKAPPAGSTGESGSVTSEQRPATKSVGDSVPPMHPGDDAKTGASTTTTPGTAGTPPTAGSKTGATEMVKPKTNSVQ